MAEPSDFIPSDQADGFLCIPESLAAKDPQSESSSGYVLPPSSPSPPPSPNSCAFVGPSAVRTSNSSPPTFSPGQNGQTGSVQVITGEEFYVEQSDSGFEPTATQSAPAEDPIIPEPIASTLCIFTGLPYMDHNYANPTSKAPPHWDKRSFSGSQSRSITLTINDVSPYRPTQPLINSLSDFSNRYFQPSSSGAGSSRGGLDVEKEATEQSDLSQTRPSLMDSPDKNSNSTGSVRFMTNGAFVGRFKTSDAVSTGRISKTSPFITQFTGAGIGPLSDVKFAQKSTPVLTAYPSSVGGGSKVYQLVKDESSPQANRFAAAESPSRSRYLGTVPPVVGGNFFISPSDEVITNVTANEESDAEIPGPEQMLRVSAANTLASLNAFRHQNYNRDRTDDDVRIIAEQQLAHRGWTLPKPKDRKKRVYKTSFSAESQKKMATDIVNAAVLQKKNEVQKAYEKTLRALGPLLSPRSSDRESSSSDEEVKIRGISPVKQPPERKIPGKRGRPPGSTMKSKLITANSAKPKSVKRRSKDTKGSGEEDEEWQEPYTTRCICGYTHNDDFMIECDKCNVWQHGDCVGVKRSKVPPKYLCELCDLRYLDKERARKLQKRKRREDGYSSSSDSDEGKPTAIAMHRSPVKQNNSKSDAQRFEHLGYLEKYEEAFVNDYSPGIKQAIKANGPTLAGALLLEQLKVKFCDVMDVEADRQGLVAVRTIPPAQPIFEFRGQFTLNSETDVVGILSRPHPFVLFYQLGGDENVDVCVDARKIGNAGRFVRRSCQANSYVSHVIEGQSLHLVVIAKELIERGTEISIPFDFNVAACPFFVECACNSSDCRVKSHNASLFPNTGVSSELPSVEVEVKSSPVRKGKPGRKKGSGNVERNRTASDSKKSPHKERKPKEKTKKWKVKFGATSAKMAAAQKLHKSISAMRAKPLSKIPDAAVAAAESQQQSEGEISNQPPQKKYKKKLSRTESQEADHQQKLTREDKKLQGLLARFEKMEPKEKKPKKGKVGRPKGKTGKSKELKDLCDEVELIRRGASSRQDSVTDQSILSGDEHSESANAQLKSKRTKSIELSGLQDYWVKKEMTGTSGESWLLPKERQGHISREDRKAQEYMARLERLEQSLAKKRKRSVSSSSSVKVKTELDSGDEPSERPIKTVAAKKASPSARSSKRNFSGSGSSSDTDQKRSPRKAPSQARLPRLKKNLVSDWLEDSHKSEDTEVPDTSQSKTNVMSSSEGIPARKRWLRQAMSETEQADQSAVPSTPGTPLKKRRVVEEDAGVSDVQISDCKVDSSVDVVRVEVPDTPFSCALRSIYSGGQETEEFLERELNALKEERVELPLRSSMSETCVSAADSTTPNNWTGEAMDAQTSTSASEEAEVKMEPECPVEPSKKKMSLSEYRQRKKETPSTPKDPSKQPVLAHSFSVPVESTVTSADPVLPSFSLPPVPGIIKGSRLPGSLDAEPKLPLPKFSAPITSATVNAASLLDLGIDELKERIYGRTAVAHSSDSTDGTPATPPQEFRSSRPRTPPPVVDSSQVSSDEATPSTETPRLSLSDRLRMEFGVEPEPDPTSSVPQMNMLGANVPVLGAPVLGLGVSPDLTSLPLRPSMPGMGVPPHMPVATPLPPVMMQQMAQMGQIAMRMVSAMNHMLTMSTSTQQQPVVASTGVSVAPVNAVPTTSGRDVRSRPGQAESRRDQSDWPTDESRPRSSNDSHRSSHRSYSTGRGRNRFP